jgi:hypothetical protein
MIYLSKGAVLMASGRDRIVVTRCGSDHILNGDIAKVWLAGRFGVAAANDEQTRQTLRHLDRLGLVEVSEAEADIARYRLLINCVICPAAQSGPRAILGAAERRVWKWINGAGFKLRISELIMLAEKGVKPAPALFGKGNWQSLVDIIYTTETIFDGILDANMEHSPARGATADAVLGLLLKKRILLV